MDYVVSLSGPSLSKTVKRIKTALHVCREIGSEQLILSGFDRESVYQTNPELIDALESYTQKHGVEIFYDAKPTTTSENTDSTLKLLKSKDVDEVHVVTDGSHYHRALNAFKNLEEILDCGVEGHVCEPPGLKDSIVEAFGRMYYSVKPHKDKIPKTLKKFGKKLVGRVKRNY